MHYYPIPPRVTSAKLYHPLRGPFAVLGVLAPTRFLLRDAIYTESPPFTAHFFKLKHYRHLPVCTADSLPILPTDQVPPVAIEVTVPHTVDPPSTEDSAASLRGGNGPELPCCFNRGLSRFCRQDITLSLLIAESAGRYTTSAK
ncbi:unnamed protein product [Schistocephalus solidus]|uniref:Uncharacterized protein n=1 Tax=Schistocephalus solidus TaxID=70667 RepID=A0A183SZR0_SCHSO|nr:unnamed protein product [Schistocephalus solidus]